MATSADRDSRNCRRSGRGRCTIELKGYAGTDGLACSGGTDCSNGPLQSSWDSEKWPRAAEIIRYGKTSRGAGSGWNPANIRAFLSASRYRGSDARPHAPASLPRNTK